MTHCCHCMKELSEPFKSIPGSRFPQSDDYWHHYCRKCWLGVTGPRANCYACVRNKIRCPYHDYDDDTEEGPYKRRKEYDDGNN